MSKQTDALQHMIREVRTCFNQMKELTEKMHADLGINPSMRSVLEGLNTLSPKTVPDLARERGVSRQHVQKVVNQLYKLDLVTNEPNPDHAKSVLIAMTPKGKALFAEVEEREKVPMNRLSKAISLNDLNCATAALSSLNEALRTLND